MENFVLEEPHDSLHPISFCTLSLKNIHLTCLEKVCFFQSLASMNNRTSLEK